MKKIILAMMVFFATFTSGDDLIVFDNEYNILPLKKKIKRVIIGNKDMINVSLLKGGSSANKYLKIFGKKTGTTSILLVYRDGTMQNYHVYVNKNLGYIQKMINMIEPTLKLNKVGDSAAVITGSFSDPHNKKRVYALLENAGMDMDKLMDLTETTKVNKMVRTKLYLVEINNQKAKDLGGVTGLGFLSDSVDFSINPTAGNGATFSGWLLDNMGRFSTQSGKSVTGTLNFLEQKGVGKILDDTVLITTEDENATFRVGGEVYIPVGMTQNVAGLPPTILLEEKKYGLKLIMTTQFMEKDGYMHIQIDIVDSQFDTNKEHDVQLGENVYVPSFVSKNITTNVVVKSGQVIALGGRLHTEDIESEEKIPFLGDIPLLGELFKHTVSGVKNNDLLFFLVPEIVDANENVNDTHYYRDFKNNSVDLHTEFENFDEDTNTTDEDLVDSDADMAMPKNEPLAVENDTQSATKPKQETVVIIEDEKPSSEDIIEVNTTKKEAPIILQQRKTDVEDNKTMSPKSVVQPKTQDVKKEKKVSDAAMRATNEVSIRNIYIRDNPSLENSKRVMIWKKGHKFVSDAVKDVDGVEWLKIVADCEDAQKCTPLQKPLWISKKYTNAL